MSAPPALLLAAHGSRNPASAAQFAELVEQIRRLVPERRVHYGFLEFNTPTLEQAAKEAVAEGATEMVLVPGMLLAATHTKNDLPSELRVLREEHPEVTFHAAAALDLHPLLLEVCRERLLAAEAQAEQLGEVRRSETLLLVVGRGTTDPDANGDIHKLARFLEEGLGYGGSLVCYSGTAQPDLTTGLARAAALGFRRVLVLPYLLFGGVLSQRVAQAVAAAEQRFPQVQWGLTGLLGPDPKVARVFIERAEQGVVGEGHMNCTLCKYRTAVIGYEGERGAPQIGHHGGVRGQDARPATEKTVIPHYVPHPIEAQSFQIIEGLRDWSTVPPENKYALQRLVHTAGDLDIVDDLFFSAGAIEAGIHAMLRGLTVVTDVTMVQTGLKREVISRLGVPTWCGVHDPETHLLSRELGLTRSAAGMRRAYEKFGNDCILAIGDAPTAIFEAVRLIRERHWRPGLVIGLPVGFVGTEESKKSLKTCLSVPRITNSGFRGGSPWASSVVNSCLIEAQNRLADLTNVADLTNSLES